MWSNETFFPAVICQSRSEDEFVLLRIDTICIQLLQHVVECIQCIFVFAHTIANFIKGSFCSSAPCNICLVTYCCAEMTYFDVGREVLTTPAADAVYKVLCVG